MAKVTFITGNQSKADLLARYLDSKVPHVKLDLDELQSLDLHEIVEHKVRQAYEKLSSPVLVEDVGLEFKAWGHLPGPFIKWFEKEIGLEGMCRLLDEKNRSAVARICFAYYDGKTMRLFDGKLTGTVPDKPRGEGFGWNPIFVPDGHDKTFAELQDEGSEISSLRATTVYPQIKSFLSEIDKK